MDFARCAMLTSLPNVDTHHCTSAWWLSVKMLKQIVHLAGSRQAGQAEALSSPTPNAHFATNSHLSSTSRPSSHISQDGPDHRLTLAFVFETRLLLWYVFLDRKLHSDFKWGIRRVLEEVKRGLHPEEGRHGLDPGHDHSWGEWLLACKQILCRQIIRNQ